MQRANLSWQNYDADIIETLVRTITVDDYAEAWLNADEPKCSSALAGKKIDIVFDGGVVIVSYTFEDDHTLNRTGGSYEGKSYYRAIEAPGHPQVVFVQHYCDGLVPSQCVTMALDFESGFATVCDAHLGTHPTYARQVFHEVHVGLIRGIDNVANFDEPAVSAELVGQGIVWELPVHPRLTLIKQSYLSDLNNVSTYVDATGAVAQTIDEIECFKLRDNLYLSISSEVGNSGMQTVLLFDTDTLQAAIATYGLEDINKDGEIKPAIVCDFGMGIQGVWAPLETIF